MKSHNAPAKLSYLGHVLMEHRTGLPVDVEVTEANGESLRRVGFFLGCAQSLMFAEESSATVRVLTRNSCNVTTPKEVVCCRMPPIGYGRLDLVRKPAKHNISLFEKYNLKVVVTDCATCQLAFSLRPDRGFSLGWLASAAACSR